jgi:hypothetical protein
MELGTWNQLSKRNVLAYSLLEIYPKWIWLLFTKLYLNGCKKPTKNIIHVWVVELGLDSTWELANKDILKRKIWFVKMLFLIINILNKNAC